MLDNFREWQESVRKVEEKVGDIYRECIACGCKKNFLQSLDTKIWFFLVEQIKLFLKMRSSANAYNAEKDLEQWQTYL